MEEDELIEAALAYDMQLQAERRFATHQRAPRQGESTSPVAAMASSPDAAQALQEPAMVSPPCAPGQAAEALQEPAMVTPPCAPCQAECAPARKRLRGKQQPLEEAPQEHALVPWVCAPSPPQLPLQEDTPEPTIEWEVDDALDGRQIYHIMRYRLKKWAVECVKRMDQGLPDPWPRDWYNQLHGRWCRRSPILGGIIMQALRRTAAPACVTQYATATYNVGCPEETEDRAFLNQKQALMTWNGDWGLIDVDGQDGESQEGPDGVPPATSRLANIHDWRVLVGLVQELPSVIELWKQFQIWIQQTVYSFFLVDWAASMEICMDTWKSEKQVRVHLHFSWKTQQRLHCRNMALWTFRGCKPHISLCVAILATRAVGSWCGMYYLVCPKIGKVFSSSSKEPFLQFPVSGEWIFALLQGEKIEIDDAREQLIRTGKGLVRRLADLEALEQQRKQKKLQVRIDTLQQQLFEQNAAFRVVPEIEAWRAAACVPGQRRKKFLVLEGPSGVGKTEYCRAMFGPRCMLELNAAGLEKPPSLRGFQWEQHKLVLFDEASVKMVLGSRKLFQAPACWVDLGHSPTGRDVYRVFMADAVIVVASNKWSHEVHGLNGSDREWIQSNQVLVNITEPLFLPNTSS